MLAAVPVMTPPAARAQATDSVDFSTSLTRIDGFGFSDAFGQSQRS